MQKCDTLNETVICWCNSRYGVHIPNHMTPSYRLDVFPNKEYVQNGLVVSCTVYVNSSQCSNWTVSVSLRTDTSSLSRNSLLWVTTTEELCGIDDTAIVWKRVFGNLFSKMMYWAYCFFLRLYGRLLLIFLHWTMAPWNPLLWPTNPDLSPVMVFIYYSLQVVTVRKEIGFKCLMNNGEFLERTRHHWYSCIL